MTGCAELPVEIRRRVGAWLVLGLISLSLSSVFALMLAGARAPGWTALPLLEGFFTTALVLHVNLSVTVWFMAVAGALWSLAGGEGRAGLDWMALGCVGLGAVLLVVSPWSAPGDPVLSDYLPTLRNPVFVGGCLALWVGMTMAAMRAVITIPPMGMVTVFAVPGSGLFGAAVYALLAMLAFLVSFVRLPQALTDKAYFDPLYWAGGHVMQFAHLLSMLTVWLVLARGAGMAWPMANRTLRWLFLAGLFPVLLAVYPGLFYAPESVEQRWFFTGLMSWGSWQVALIFAIGMVAVWLRGRGVAEVGGSAGTALWGSMLLFFLGVGTGGLIHGDTVMVTAHYHGTVGAVTLAYMGMITLLLPRLGFSSYRPLVPRVQAALYVFGLGLLIIGLAWSGTQGAPRKTPMIDHGADMVRAPEGMALMGAGATIALVATVLFLIPALRAMLWRSARPGRWPMVGMAVVLIVLTGGAIRLLPDSNVDLPAQTAEVDVDPVLVRRFQEGVVMLHAKRYDHAMTAFHWVLQRAPEVPEAHVNMGFALIGLERYAVARDFFNTAIALRPTQVNAYYGLAMALEGLQEMEGARGAMRTFIHLSPEDSPFLPKARAALWEWESSK